MNDDDIDYVKAPEIAKKYKVTPRTIFKWADEGKIPCLRFEGTVRFDPVAVRAAITGQKAGSVKSGTQT